MYKRVVIKISGEALQGHDEGASFCNNTIDRLVGEIKDVKNQGVHVSLVVGGGNFWRGRNTGDIKKGMDRTKSDQIGMLATVMNAIYLAESFRLKGIDSVIMTPFIVNTFTEQFEKTKALKCLEYGIVLIFAGGTGHPFFSTDTISAIRAAELEADAILFAKNVNGIYNKDPLKCGDAVRYQKISYDDIIRNDLRAIDISAMSICKEQGIESVVFDLNEPGGILKAVSADEDTVFDIGTRVYI